MPKHADSLLDLTARDVMSEDVVTISEQLDLRGAARLLSQNQISGAPVVDGAGCCIGVLSAGDFIDSAKRGAPSQRQEGVWHSYYVDWHTIDIESLPTELVRDRMTADPVTIDHTTPLQKVASMLIDADIHRVIVVDEERRPVGLVSATDIVAAVAKANA